MASAHMAKFYKNAANYWANVPATIDGILGGYGHISEIDVKASQAFLSKIFSMKNPPGNKLALDCGAGIGRVSKYVLIPQFDKVDLVEQDDKFINTAKQFIGEGTATSKLGTMYCVGLQNFEFEPYKKYDVIWCQWVLGHLDDFSLVEFLKNCTQALANNGVIIIKENITTSETIDFDEQDSSVTRPLNLMKEIFQSARLEILFMDIQDNFPDDIYEVYSFALSPSALVVKPSYEIV